MKDGLYRVTTKYLCAGFVVQDGYVTACAPILVKKLDYWKTVAIYAASTSTTKSPSPPCQPH